MLLDVDLGGHYMLAVSQQRSETGSLELRLGLSVGMVTGRLAQKQVVGIVAVDTAERSRIRPMLAGT